MLPLHFLRRRGFTLVELLLVVTIILILIALLQPALIRMRDTARDVDCKAKLSDIGEAFRLFASDNNQRLPAASIGSWQGVEPWEKCWIGKEGRVPGRFEPTHDGVASWYLGNAGAVGFYRCPALVPGVIGTGFGSNGSFDYAMTLSFSGARMRAVPLTSRVIYQTDHLGVDEGPLPTPLIIDEDPVYHNNSLSIEPGFGSIDRSPMRHPNRSANYAAMDGGVKNLPVPPDRRAPQAWEWFCIGPSGNLVRLNTSVPYRSWRTQ